MDDIDEFVSIDEQDRERDWISPVYLVEETDVSFTVDNGCHTYEVVKQKGWKYVRRIREVSHD